LSKIIDKATDKATEVIDTFIEPIKVRLSNPFLCSLIIAFILVNWRPILYITFSKTSIEEKISYININYYSSAFGNLWMYVILPIVISSVYTFGIPWFNNLVDYINSKPLKEKRKTEHDLTIEEYKRKVLYAQEEHKIKIAQSGSLELSSLTAQIQNLHNDVNVKSKRLSELENINNDQKIQLSEVTEKFSKQNNRFNELIAKYQNGKERDNVFSQLNNSNDKSIKSEFEFVERLSKIKSVYDFADVSDKGFLTLALILHLSSKAYHFDYLINLKLQIVDIFEREGLSDIHLLEEAKKNELILIFKEENLERLLKITKSKAHNLYRNLNDIDGLEVFTLILE